MLTPRISLLAACSVLLAACEALPPEAPEQQGAVAPVVNVNSAPQIQNVSRTYIAQQRPQPGSSAQQYANTVQQPRPVAAIQLAQRQVATRPAPRPAPRPSARPAQPPRPLAQRPVMQAPPIAPQTIPTLQAEAAFQQPPRQQPPQATGQVQYAAGRMYSGPGQLTRLPDVVATRLQLRGISEQGMSAYVRPASAQAPALLTANADTPRNPASTMKLVTTYAALSILGPNYRWPTEIYTTGTVRGGTLYGDVIIKGYGDPMFGEPDFRTLLQALRSRGINSIQGNLVADNSFFNVPYQHPGAFDGNANAAYNAQPEAILYQERGGCYEFTNLKGKVERICPVLPSNAAARADLNTNLFGGFWKLWVGELRGRMQGRFVRGVTPAHAQLVYTHLSRPVREVIVEVNKDSNNVMARQLLLSVGAKQLGAPSTPQKGAQAVGQWLESRGLNFPELRIENGSGLSRIERISARHLGELLVDAYNSPYRQDYMNSLAVLGVDGTLKNRMKNNPVAGRGRFKTGTLRDVRGLAGYINAANGQTYVVSILHNDARARSNARDAHDELVEWVFWGNRNNNMAMR